MLNPRFFFRSAGLRSGHQFAFSLCLILSFFVVVVVWQRASRAAQGERRQSPAAERHDGPATRAVGYRSPSGRHKLRVSDPQVAKQLIRRGARLIAGYGAFQILSADEITARAVGDGHAVEFNDEANLLLLNAGALDTTSPELQLKRSRLPAVADGESALHLIQFAAPLKPEWYGALTDTGVRVVAYIPNNAYLVYGDAQSLARLQDWALRAACVQWDGEYEPAYKVDPNIKAARRGDNATADADKELLAVQLVADGDGNQATLQTIANLKVEPVRSQFALLQYLNVIVKLPVAAIERVLALRPDVVSITRYVEPVKLDERQNMIVAGNLSGASPAPGDYLNYLAGQGLTQSQFAASGFAVNISDSGIDNATTTPNHFALYTGGNTANASRVIYNRLEGTPNNGSTLEGCDGHGNLNAHIVAGFVPSGFPFNAFPHADASGFRYGLGVAPFVKVGATVIFDPNRYTFPNLVNVESKAYNDSARISSNSWGASVNGGYNIDAQAYDSLVRDAQPTGSAFPQAGNQEMVIVFASGNQGPVSNSVNSPGSAKNVITVGAAESVQAIGGADACNIDDTGANSANDMTSFSSRGPTTDGRKKPELVAPGTHITGGVPQIANPPQNGQPNLCYTGGGVCGGLASIFFPAGQQFYTASSGTSHSAPAVAGAAALLRQRFLNASLAPPSPAMTKAVLMNSARYLTGANANDPLWSNAQGMGEVNLTSAFDLFSTPAILRDQAPSDTFTASGQTRLFAGTISDTSKPFRVTLAWTDAPGSTVGDAYVNNLNLEVTVGGQTYAGNVFSGAFSTTGGTADNRNNVESVLIPAGATGPFVVKITAANIAGDGVPNSGGTLDQDFALVVANAVLTPQPVIATAGAVIAAESCAPGNSAIDPGETVTVNFALQNVGTANTTNLVATLQAGGGVINPSAAQTYGALTAGGTAASRSFTFTAGGTCGGTLAATLTLQDGATTLGSVTFNLTLGTATTSTTTFTNNALITIPAGAPATTSGSSSPYPSTINVSGLSGAVSQVTVKLNNLNHTFPDDIDVLLVGPTGQAVVLMSDAGGSTDLVNAIITFDDTGTPVPDATAITSGTYAPADYGGVQDVFPAPAPSGPYPNPPRLSAFNGLSPNGTWSLYVVDDADEEVGNILNGWSLTITTSVPVCCSAGGCGTITIDPPTLSAAVAGAPYSQTLTQTGGVAPVNFSLSGTVPPGLMLSGAMLTGTPTQNGNFAFTVTVVDNNGCIGNRNYTLTVSCPTITINPTTLPDAAVNTIYSQTLTRTGGVGPVTFSVIGTLPSGMTLTGGGLLSGTPAEAGTFNFGVQVTDANGCTGTRVYTLLVNRLQFFPLAHPIRLLDTRQGAVGCDAPGAPIAGGTSRTQTARRTCDGLTIPANAAAVTGNITTVESGGGYLTLYPSDAQQPLAANSNYSPNEILNNVFTVGLGSADGAFKIFVTTTTDIVIDVTGYYAPPGDGGLYFHPLPKPIRLLETRVGGTGCTMRNATLPGGVDTMQQARGACDGVTIPATAQAIVGNATTVNPQGPGFPYLTLFPANAVRPTVASSNYLPGQVMNAPFTVGLSPAGEFKIYPTTTTDLVIDVLGYYSPDASDVNGAGLLFNPLPQPVRLLETRAGGVACYAPSAPLQAGSTRLQFARGICSGVTIANSALAIVGNATVVNSNGGYLTFWPSTAAQPLVATSNFAAGQILNRHFIVGLGAADGAFNIFTQFTTDVVVDVSGYFAP